VLKFGYINSNQVTPLLPAIFAAVILGTIAGLLGAGFTWTVQQTHKFRKAYVTSNSRKAAEVTFYALITALSFFALVKVFHRCAPLPTNSPSFQDYQSKSCENNEYSPMATMVFNSQGG
jgi:H+/Cl- antiporter ClcA